MMVMCGVHLQSTTASAELTMTSLNWLCIENGLWIELGGLVEESH